MRMPLNPRLAADKVDAALGLKGAIVAPLKKKAANEPNDNKPAKKKAAPRKKKA